MLTIRPIKQTGSFQCPVMVVQEWLVNLFKLLQSLQKTHVIIDPINSNEKAKYNPSMMEWFLIL